jgi:kinesin family protein 6/9
MHDSLMGRSRVQYEPYSEAQKTELAKRVKSWLEGGEEEIEMLTLRQMKEVMNIFKVLYIKASENTDKSDQVIVIKSNASTSAVSQVAADREQSATVDEEDGVGELDGNGFSVGVVRQDTPNSSYLTLPCLLPKVSFLLLLGAWKPSHKETSF